jgi:hypothetical protein
MLPVFLAEHECYGYKICEAGYSVLLFYVLDSTPVYGVSLLMENKLK